MVCGKVLKEQAPFRDKERSLFLWGERLLDEGSGDYLENAVAPVGDLVAVAGNILSSQPEVARSRHTMYAC